MLAYNISQAASAAVNANTIWFLIFFLASLNYGTVAKTFSGRKRIIRFLYLGSDIE